MLAKLHLAKDMEALNATVEVTTSVTNARTLAQSALKMFKRAGDSFQCGDQEMAYVFYMRYLQLVTSIKKTSDFKTNSKYYTELLGSKNMTSAIQRAEELQTSLVRRYDERKAVEVASKLASMPIFEEAVMEDVQEENGGGDDANVAPQLPGGIIPIHLYRRLKEGKEKILVIDVRPRAEFEEARMKFPDQVVQVPAELVLPGTTLNRIEPHLSPESRRKLNGRGDAALVVLVDWDGSVAELDDPRNSLKTMKDALFKFDAESRLKTEPVVLEGGFEDWFEHYPTYTVGRPTKKKTQPALYSIDEAELSLPFDYDLNAVEYGTSIPAEQVKVPKPLTQKLIDEPSSDLTPESIGLYEGFPREEARVADISNNRGRPRVDRSLKPLSSEEDLSDQQSSSSEWDPPVNVRDQVAADEFELGRIEHELKKRQKDLKDLEYDLSFKNQEMKRLNDEIVANRAIRDREEKEREQRRREEEERMKETEELRIQRKQKEAEERRREMKREQALRAEEERKKAEMLQEKKNLEAVKQLAEEEAARVAIKKDAVEAAREAMLSEVRQKPKPKSSNMQIDPSSSETPSREYDEDNEDPEDSKSRSTARRTPSDTSNDRGRPIVSERVAEQTEKNLSWAEDRSPRRGIQRKQEVRPRREPSDPEFSPQSSVQSVSLRPTISREQKPTPLVDRTAKPNSNNNAGVVVDWNSRLESLRPVNGGEGRGLTGLRNLGNTCYMNSIIQCLSCNGFLAHYFLADNFVADINLTSRLGHRGELAIEFATLVRALWCGYFQHISPRTFKHTVGRINNLFVGNDQQDSSELLMFLLDGVHEDLNRIPWNQRPVVPEQNNDNVGDVEAANLAWHHHKSLNDSVVVSLFQGQLKSTVMCLTCRKKSVTFDPFVTLSLPVPPENRSCSIEECFRLFLREERMSGSSQWNCPKCQRPRDAVKKIDVWRLPMILIIHLKRFSSDGYRHRKIQVAVDFPVSNKLDMRSYMASASAVSASRYDRYSLYAISNHYGSMEGGHYTAYANQNNSWYKFDDHEVYRISSQEVKSSAAYILFYTAQDFPKLSKEY